MTHPGAPRSTIAALAFILFSTLFSAPGCVMESSDTTEVTEVTELADLTEPTELGDVEGSGAACRSTVDASGQVCTTCRGDGQRGPECLPAQCSVIDRCLRCVDPRGRVARDCSIDYEELPSAGLGIQPVGSFMASCHFLSGIPNKSGTTCHYPGNRTCTVSRAGNTHCLTCTYPDGSGTQICGDRSEPLPDPRDSRPDDLPAPGRCAFELGADGRVSCATCTRRDRSATRSCSHPGIVACSVFPPDGALATCTFEDDREVLLCNSPSGPEPVDAPSCPAP